MGGVTVKARTLVLGIVITIAVVATASAVFTTFDNVSSGGRDCGSPVSPATRTDRGCDAELAHARATRTAALAWAVVSLTSGWAGASFTARRRNTTP
jgi:hypothetical protein